MFERFTDRARRVVVLAQEEARMLNHNYIGTEHILLGLIREREGAAAFALTSLGISLEAVRGQVDEIVGRGPQAPSGHIPFTPRGKKVMELSLREALQFGHDYIGTEHLLLGLIREGEGVAAQVLVKLGADLNRVRQQATQLLRLDPGKAGQEIAAHDPSPGRGGLADRLAQARAARRGALGDIDAPPQVRRSYVAAQWFDDEAIAWASQGIEAGDARYWQDLGLRPAEGGRLTRQGESPSKVVRDWWRAGIPYDEVADWLGAGLTAQEATTQRARGITQQQAAALRALQATTDQPTPPSPTPPSQTGGADQAGLHGADSHIGNRHDDPFYALKRQVHRQLLQHAGPKLYDSRITPNEIEQKVRLTLQEVLAGENTRLTLSDRTRVAKELSNEIIARRRH